MLGKVKITLLSVLIILGMTLSYASAAIVVDGVGNDAEWATATTAVDPANDVLPGPLPTPSNDSGYDLVEIRIYVDTATNDLYFLLKTLGVPGDADGDGNPAASSVSRIRDFAGVGAGETYRILLDCSNDGVIDHWIVITNNVGTVYDVQSGSPVAVPGAIVTWAIGDGSDAAHKSVEIKVNGTQICAPFIASSGFTFQLEAFSDTVFDGAPNDLVPDTGMIVVQAQLIPSINVEKTITPDAAFPGEDVTVDITVTNNGDLPLCNILITDTLPACLTLAQGNDDDLDNDGISDDEDTDDDNDGIPDLEDDDSDNDGVPDLTETDTDGDGTADKYDDDDDNDGIPDIDDPDDNNDGILDVDDIDGDGIENAFDADADGDGQIDAADSDDDNDGLADAVDCTTAPEELVFDIGCLDPGVSDTVSVDLTVVCSTAQTVTNTAQVQGTTTDVRTVTDQATATVEIVIPEPGLSISKVKTAGPDLVEINAPAGTMFTLLITATNTGNTDLSGVEVRDTIPRELGLVSFTQSQGTVNVDLKGGRDFGRLGKDKIKWLVGDLAAGAGASLEMVVETIQNPKHPDRYMPKKPDPTYLLNKGAVVKGVDTVTNAKLHDGPSNPVVVSAVGDDDDDNDGICNADDNDDDGNGIPDDQDDEKRKKREKRHRKMKHHKKR